MLAYGAPALMLAAYGITFYIYLPKFYADWVGIDLALIGIIALASRLWDAVTDPTIGFLSDRTRSRFGRRRPWMTLATLPLAVTYYLLFAPPPATGAIGATRLALLAFLFFLFWTMVAVPYESLGAEISFDYDERNRLFGVREGSVLVGTLIGGALPALFEGASGQETAAGFETLGLLYGTSLVVLMMVCVFMIRERRWSSGPAIATVIPPVTNPFPLRRNRPFVILQVSYTIYALGAATAATVFLFFVEHVLRSARGPLFLALYLGLGTVFLPLWVALAKRWEKRAAWMLSLGVNAGAFVAVAFIEPGQGTLFGILISLSAVGLGGTLAIPSSMQADVIDYDEWKSHRRREGRFIGMWALAKKLAMALGAGLALPVLDWSGYVGGTPLQTESTVTALRWLYVGGPVICNITALLIAWWYPIDRKMHKEIRDEINRRAPTRHHVAEAHVADGDASVLSTAATPPKARRRHRRHRRKHQADGRKNPEGNG
jgi:glycoside/pentoside/hexuronide:cation symporter, GPH family